MGSGTPCAQTEGIKQTAAIQDFLRQLLSERLKVPFEQIETSAGYYEMGLTSMMLLEVVQTIGTKIGTTLSPTLLFEYTTIAELATHFAENYAARFQQAGITTGSGESMCGERTAGGTSGRYFF